MWIHRIQEELLCIIWSEACEITKSTLFQTLQALLTGPISQTIKTMKMSLIGKTNCICKNTTTKTCGKTINSWIHPLTSVHGQAHGRWTGSLRSSSTWPILSFGPASLASGLSWLSLSLHGITPGKPFMQSNFLTKSYETWAISIIKKFSVQIKSRMKL